MIGFLLDVFEANRGKEAIVWRDRSFPYEWLLERVRAWTARLEAEGAGPGTTVALEADFSPQSVSLFLALAGRGCILIPLTLSVRPQKAEFLETAEAELLIELDGNDEAIFTRTGRRAAHPVLTGLRDAGTPGLILFSSGSTGKSKAAVHDLAALLEKFKTPRPARRSITFLLYDHIGGVNTMLHNLSNGGCLVTAPDRTPDGVLGAVARHRAELLPASPTFLNLILLSEAWRRHDLGSLKLVTYGTEPMPESTLKRFHEALPHVALQQTYGLSEVGILRSKSRASDSLWVKIGGEGFETRIVDGILQIKAKSAMLGYLNAPSPFTDDGWFNTGDQVETDGEWIRILGRKSEIINVGGEKVHPAEVEGVIQEMDNVAGAVVTGERNPITGMIVKAKVQLIEPEEPRPFAARLKAFCRERLPAYKVPVKVEITNEETHGARFKRMRRG